MKKPPKRVYVVIDTTTGDVESVHAKRKVAQGYADDSTRAGYETHVVAYDVVEGVAK